MAVTPNVVWWDVSSTDNVRIQRGEVEFVDILVDADLGCKNEAAAVGIVERVLFAAGSDERRKDLVESLRLL